MRILIAGQNEARCNYLVLWLDHYLGKEGSHEVFSEGFSSNWDPCNGRREWLERLRTSNADVLVQADELYGAHACRLDPVGAAAVNVGGTAVLAQAAAEAVVPFVYLSDSSVVLGADLYGLTKLAGEQAASLFARKTGVQIIRLHGVYGPGAPHGADAPAPNRYVERALNREEILAHDTVYRGWTYVADAARAVRLIIEDGSPGLWNVGCFDNELSMHELAEAACAAAYSDDGPLHSGRASNVVSPAWDPGVPPRFTVDTAALRSLGWEPEVDLEEGLREIVAAW